METGAKAPDFKLLDQERQERSLSEFSGKKVVAFFPAVFSGVCDKEMCAFRDSMAELNDMDASVVAISIDGPFANKEFAKRNALEFPVLSDYSRDTVSAYGVLLEDFAGMPGYKTANRSVFILDNDNVIRYKWIAENPGIEPDYGAIKEELKKM
jgi:peroxiredoxin